MLIAWLSHKIVSAKEMASSVNQRRHQYPYRKCDLVNIEISRRSVVVM